LSYARMLSLAADYIGRWWPSLCSRKAISRFGRLQIISA